MYDSGDEAASPDDFSKVGVSETECLYTGFASANPLGPVGEETCHQGHCMIVDANRVLRAQIPGTNVLEHMQDQMVHVELHFR